MGAAMPASTALDTGRPVNRIDDYEEWYARFETSLRGQQERQRRSGVLPLLPAFRESSREAATWDAPADRFAEAVREAGVGGRDGGDGGGIPSPTSDLIRKYVADLRHLGLL
jgi:fatty acid CoA ligase FadD9